MRSHCHPLVKVHLGFIEFVSELRRLVNATMVTWCVHNVHMGLTALRSYVNAASVLVNPGL